MGANKMSINDVLATLDTINERLEVAESRIDGVEQRRRQRSLGAGVNRLWDQEVAEEAKEVHEHSKEHDVAHEPVEQCRYLSHGERPLFGPLYRGDSRLPRDRQGRDHDSRPERVCPCTAGQTRRMNPADRTERYEQPTV